MKPNKVLLFIIAVMAGLGALCLILPHRLEIGTRTLRWPTLAEVFSGHPDTAVPEADTTAVPEPVDTVIPEAPKPKPVIPKVVVDENTDSRLFLKPFYESLAEADEHVVRVIHYGDSQIEEDRMTSQIRDHLQNRFGGKGVGLLPVAQTIPSTTVRQELFMNGKRVNPYMGPRRYLSYAGKDLQRADGKYGMMGQMIVMADSLVSGSEDLMAVCRPTNAARHYTRWRVFADSTVDYYFTGDTVYLQGKGAVYGLSQECENGVIVDNIPMRGCLGLVFTKMDSTLLSDFYQSENVRLIIMQFGGNAIPFNETPSTINAIVKGLRDQVQYIRSCAPEAAVLFIGPSDMMHQVEGEWETYPMVPYMDKLLRKMALEENIAYFSLYRWMGGMGSMLRWQENGLAGSDGVHFNRSGARKAGNAVAEWILEGMSTAEPINDEPEK